MPKGTKPNILVIWGDDIGVHNLSAYNHGIMGYRTPNIDRLAKEGALFTDAYAQQSCTAGRASFILGQHPFRTGLLTIGMPGSEHGIPDWSPTIADLLKAQGYVCGQFGKNHLGDRDKHLPRTASTSSSAISTTSTPRRSRRPTTTRRTPNSRRSTGRAACTSSRRSRFPAADRRRTLRPPTPGGRSPYALSRREPVARSAKNGKQPNILVIWGDDIGQSNLSCYTHGLMGYHTPNIDRIAKEGMLFTDSYGEQSCTAGRSSFITGQSVYRTGLSKVGTPAAPIGMSEKLVTIAALLKEQGYATGQFGKNHLGDLNPMLPTNHGFDEFFGNLYHLNAEEEPEMYNYPKDPRFRERFGPRGVIHSWATDKDDKAVMPRWGKVGKQKIKDTGSLNTKRMETCDDEFVAAAKDFIKRQNKAGKPWFVWLNTTHMHFITHTKKKSLGQAGEWQSPYHDTMVDHDRNVGEMLDLLDQLGIAENTFVQYSTDNGPHRNSWPDAGTTPFRSEKNTNWEGAFRVPLLVRWPGKIKAGSVCNGIVQHHDWLPTFLAMAGAADVVDKLKKGYKAIGRTYKNHIDGFNLLPYLTGKVKESPRNFFFYFSDDGDMLGLRYDNWKIVFMEQRMVGTMGVWAEPFVRLRLPKILNLRTDPYEYAPITSNSYYDWMIHNAYFIYIAQAGAAKFAETFREFPAAQKPNTFTVDDALAKMREATSGAS